DSVPVLYLRMVHQHLRNSHAALFVRDALTCSSKEIPFELYSSLVKERFRGELLLYLRPYLLRKYPKAAVQSTCNYELLSQLLPEASRDNRTSLIVNRMFVSTRKQEQPRLIICSVKPFR